MSTEKIVGRFAPSPTGPLHFGSLSCALASYLDVRNLGGKWLVRIEDIDPPREIKGASSRILSQLEDHGLYWDDKVLFQSTRLDAYQNSLDILKQHNLAYHCECSRQRVNSLEGIYDNRCRPSHLPSTNNATRLQLNQPHQLVEFVDKIAGRHVQSLIEDVGDFVIRRRDNLFSYQLAVTVDDQYQNVTHVMRGSDLLDSTPRQIYLQHLPADQLPTCAPPMDFLMDTLPFMELIQTILLGDGNCAEYEWRFIFNFAEWAFLFFIGLVVYNLYFFFFRKNV